MWVQEAFNKAKVGQDCVVMLNGEILYRFKKTSGMVLYDLMNLLCINALTKDNWEIMKEKKTGWINIYRTCRTDRRASYVYKTKEDAFDIQYDKNNLKNYPDYITTIEIEWEE